MASDYWVQRVDNIKQKVSLRGLIDHYKIQCQSDGEITQFHCPFHGKDNHASARLYESNTMYCWVCSQKWDVISFIKDFHNLDTFSNACKFLENMFHIEKPDVAIAYQEPSFEDHLKEPKSPSKEQDFQKEFERIERLLLRSRSRFTLAQYSRYFYYYDNLYSNYKLKRYPGDLSLQVSLRTLHLEISKLT